MQDVKLVSQTVDPSKSDSSITLNIAYESLIECLARSSPLCVTPIRMCPSCPGCREHCDDADEGNGVSIGHRWILSWRAGSYVLVRGRRPAFIY